MRGTPRLVSGNAASMCAQHLSWQRLFHAAMQARCLRQTCVVAARGAGWRQRWPRWCRATVRREHGMGMRSSSLREVAWQRSMAANVAIRPAHRRPRCACAARKWRHGLHRRDRLRAAGPPCRPVGGRVAGKDMTGSAAIWTWPALIQLRSLCSCTHSSYALPLQKWREPARCAVVTPYWYVCMLVAGAAVTIASRAMPCRRR